jgi:hypothetical protein
MFVHQFTMHLMQTSIFKIIKLYIYYCEYFPILYLLFYYKKKNMIESMNNLVKVPQGKASNNKTLFLIKH